VIAGESVITSQIPRPTAWRRDDINLADDPAVFSLESAELREFGATVDWFRSQSQWRVEDLDRDAFVWPSFAPTAVRMAAELESGRGFVLLRGLPVGRQFDDDDARLIYWGISLHLGRPVSQNDRGHLLGNIVDLAELGESVDPNRRDYEGGGAFELHTDKSDIVGLLCLRRAYHGGASLLASAAEIHNVILSERPDLLESLYGTFYMDRKSEELPGEAGYQPVQVFSVANNVLSIHSESGFIFDAQRFSEVPRLTSVQLEALALLKEVGARDEMYVEMMLEPGDIQYLNNHAVLHGRRDYTDRGPVEERRHMMRIWLAAWLQRPLVDDVAALRFGVPPNPLRT
jgi:hypothetical protein